VAARRYEAQWCSDWPARAREHYVRNLVAEAIEAAPQYHRSNTAVYWAGLLDVFPHTEFDIAGDAACYSVDDGASAYEEGLDAGVTADLAIQRGNPYPPNTLRHVLWQQGSRLGGAKRVAADNIVCRLGRSSET
jgi:hypothetical protein